MKNRSIALIGACMILGVFRLTAQTAQGKTITPREPDYNKPKLFADLPDKMEFNPVQFLTLFQQKPGEKVNITISASFNFAGEVVSKSDVQGATSVVVRCTNRPGARLIFTKVTGENNSVKYLGRIISMQHGDSYEIVSENNQYYLKKKGIYDLVSE